MKANKTKIQYIVEKLIREIPVPIVSTMKNPLEKRKKKFNYKTELESYE